MGNEPADPTTAKMICESTSARLLSLQTPLEFKLVTRKIKDMSNPPNDEDLVWTSGIKFSNSTVDNLLLWSATGEPINYTQFFGQMELENRSPAAAYKLSPKIVRDKRETGEGSCKCECSSPATTTLSPLVAPSCKRPQCKIQLPDGPPCDHIAPPNCSIAGFPKCEIGDRNCTVECGNCRIRKQPECKVKSSSKPRCRLETPKCNPKMPRCTIIVQDPCVAIQESCKQDESNTCTVSPSSSSSFH